MDCRAGKFSHSLGMEAIYPQYNKEKYTNVFWDSYMNISHSALPLTNNYQLYSDLHRLNQPLLF